MTNKLFNEQKFPHFQLIKASAGTGKTYELSKRIALFLMQGIPNNELRNILAITFTVNASKEMRQRVMLWLKKIALCNKDAFKEFGIASGKETEAIKKADDLLNTILSCYKDFQIKTIDSFLTSIFKTCATEFGYPEDFHVVLNNREYMKIAFDVYLSDIDDNSNEFFHMLDLINESEHTFTFMPHDRIFKKARDLYVKEKHHIGGFVNQKNDTIWKDLIDALQKLADDISNLIKTHSIKINKNCSLQNMLNDLKKQDFYTFFTRGDNTSPILKVDLKKTWAPELDELWKNLLDTRLKALYMYSERYYYPYIAVLRAFTDKLDMVKKSKEVIFIEDIPSLILKNINEINIPDVYIRLGGRLYHYFIDEFQDTSPIQYANLQPFIENSLSQGGSLFIVGDTKQAIYGFRDTDYEIMNRLAKNNPFQSTEEYHVKSLDKNYRSGKVILDYAKGIFDEVKKTDLGQYTESGLFDWKVEVREGMEDKGYVCALLIKKQKDDEFPKEQSCIIDIINDLIKRGYSYSDIAILAHKNSHIVEVSSWLSDREIPFISFSSLDIRKRKVIKELLWLLRFLDSPSDNLSFSYFLMGEVFAKLNTKIDIIKFIFENKSATFLYINFKETYPDFWNTYFRDAFNNVGYLPVYELLCYLLRVFMINSNFPQESGAIARLLEILKNLEAEGKNSLNEFLDFITLQDEDEFESNSFFELPIPQNANAVRLMTVHKAKGLGFAVVIYLLYSLKRKRTDSLKILETDKGLKALKINQALKRGNLKKDYEKLNKKDKINDLNSLYVGLTRAKDELYFVGIAYENEKGEVNRDFPVDLIIEGEFGSKVKKDSKGIESPKEIQMTFNPNLMIHDNTYGEIAFHEKRRGEAIHLILSKINHISRFDKETIAKKIQHSIDYCKTKYNDIDTEVLTKEVLDFLNDEKIKPFFECEGKNVLIEKEFVDNNGNIIRIDRLIIFNDTISIIDFKTGDQKDTYIQQLKKYSDVIKDIYKGMKIQCYILYFDLKQVQQNDC